MFSPGERIQALRKEKNLTQEELATKIYCSKQSIYRYENNQSKMDTHTLIKTAHFLNVSSDYLLGISNQKNSNDDNHNNRYLAFYDEDYFWIHKYGKIIGGQTQWNGFAADGRDERVLRPVIPEKALELCTQMYGAPMIINTEKDAEAFLIAGGNALIRKSICKKYFPSISVPFVHL